ncbi:EcsC family protein [Ursidibacter sp. B-7004-1]
MSNNEIIPTYNTLESKYPQISESDFLKLRKSVSLLESTALIARITDWIASASSSITPTIPDKYKKKIVGIAEDSLNGVFRAANFTLENKQQTASPITHKVAVGLAGALGGIGGFATILIELPISTTIMMRSILDIAREEGFLLDDPRTQAECIMVFGLEGNLSTNDDSAESGYYQSRFGLNAVMLAVEKAALDLAEKAAAEAAAAEAAKVAANIAAKGIADVADKSLAQAIIKLIQSVASRLGVTLSEKAIAQSIPFIGAAAAATLNVMFTDFYQDMAKGHFTVKKLEKIYSEELIKKAYLDIYDEMKHQKLLK